MQMMPRLLDEQDGNDGDSGLKRAEIGDVYGEMASVLVPRVIPKNSRGEQFRYFAYSARERTHDIRSRTDVRV